MRHGRSDAEIEWESEVEREQDRLIGLGEAPWAAAEKAVRNVRDRRRERAITSGTVTAAELNRLTRPRDNSAS